MDGRGETRHALLDAYATQRCEVRLQHSFDDQLSGLIRREATEAERRRIDGGRNHEAAVLSSMAEHLGEDYVEISQDERSDAQLETILAIEQGVPVIAKAWLPVDEIGRRIGRPDLLVKTTDGYLPVEVKLHLLSTPGNGALKTSALSSPFVADATSVPGHKLRKKALWFDALQLAHYRKMLESIGASAQIDGLLGGVIDGSQTLWWIDRDLTHGRTRQRVIDAYDERFADRLALVEATIERNEDPSLPRQRSPWWHKECETCPYREHCHSELVDTDDVSLVRWSTPESLATLRAAGVTTRHQMADLDLEVIDLGTRLADTAMPLPTVIERASAADRGEPITEVVGQRTAVRRHLSAAHIETVADLVDRDPISLVLAGTVRDLGRLVRRARAGVAGGVARSIAAESIDAARADVEVDIDMESYGHATYLWGALVSTNVPVVGVDEGYRAFVTFDPLSHRQEAEIFADFWSWLTTVKQAASEQGLSFKSYCFWRAAEEGQMRQAARIGGPGLPSEGELRSFFSSEDWVDLHELCKDQLVTEGPLGLKVMATKAGFVWRDEDPSGEASIGWYEEAMESSSSRARQRLLNYNEDDVIATRALRIWLDGPARDLPHIDDIRSDFT
jgi:predicted RecB family nuclease